MHSMTKEKVTIVSYLSIVNLHFDRFRKSNF
jgi:hypothetical protein